MSVVRTDAGPRMYGPRQDAGQRVERFRSANWREALKRNWAAFRFFIPYIRPYRSKIVLAILAKLIGTPLQMVGVFVNVYLIDEVILNDRLAFEERIRRLMIVLAVQVIMWAIGHLQGTLFNWMSWYVNMRLTLDIQKKFYLHQHSLPLSWHRTRSVGEHMFRTETDVHSGVVSMITDDWIAIFDVFYQMAWAVALFTRIDPVLGLIAGGYLVPWTCINHFSNTVQIRLEYRQRELHQESQSVERDIIAGLRTYKSLGQGRFVTNRYGQCQSIVWRLIMLRNVVNWLLYQGLWFVFGTLVYERGMWLYIWTRVMLGHYTLGQVGAIWWILGQVTQPVRSLVDLVQRFRQRMIPALRMIETFSVKPTIVDRPGAIRPRRLRGDIRFERVTFGYQPERLLFRAIDLAIAAGTRLAVVGPSGTGKSTMLHLLLRLYDPLEGCVRMDGRDLRDMRIRSYLASIGVVLQETFLFSGSVFENVRYGNPLAGRDEVRRALLMADLGPTLEEWPDGLDTFMGEGTNVSGGQKQRIGIARALVRNPTVFLLDEPTAQLDIVSEQNVMATIEKVTRGRTTVIVSHRIAPVLFVDRIVVMAPGGIEAVGSHSDLLKRSATYRLLWREQQGLIGPDNTPPERPPA